MCKRETSFTWSSCSAELYTYFQSFDCTSSYSSCHPASRRPRVPLYRHTIQLASWKRLNPHISVIHHQCVGVCGFLQDVRHQESTTSESGSNRHCPNVGCADSFKKNTSYFSSYTHSCLMWMFTFLLAELSLLVFHNEIQLGSLPFPLCHIHSISSPALGLSEHTRTGRCHLFCISLSYQGEQRLVPTFPVPYLADGFETESPAWGRGTSLHLGTP